MKLKMKNVILLNYSKGRSESPSCAVKNKISRSYSLTAWLFIEIYIQYVVFILFSLHSKLKMSAILSRTTGLLGGLGVTVQPWMTLVTLAVTMGENRLIKKMSTREAVLDALNGTNEKLDEIKSMLSDIAAMTKSSFELVVDIRFKEGVEKIAAAYTVFLDVSSSQEAWETHMQQFESHVWEYKKDYALYMDPKRLEEYLNTLAGQNGFTKMSNALEFILTTEAQYLHLMVHFHSYKEDQEAVTRQFESFNEHVEFLNEVAAKEVMRIIPKHTVGSIFKGVRVEMTNCPLFFKFIVDEYVAGVEAACRCLSPAKLNTGTEGSKMTIALPYKVREYKHSEYIFGHLFISINSNVFSAQSF